MVYHSVPIDARDHPELQRPGTVTTLEHGEGRTAAVPS
jgi:hypothetical protein